MFSRIVVLKHVFRKSCSLKVFQLFRNIHITVSLSEIKTNVLHILIRKDPFPINIFQKVCYGTSNKVMMNIFKVIEVHLMEVQEVKVQFFCYT